MAHPQVLSRPVRCAVVTVSDTRTVESDRSGQIIQTLLTTAGHRVHDYRIVPDEPARIGPLCQTLAQEAEIDCIILTGGTGIAPRDTTYDAIALLLEKTLPGFGEIFRQLSFQEIGSRAMASRAVAGVYRSTLIFSLPGSSNAVTLAMEALILPELPHLVSQMQA
ncbi:MogA/MoaB family molybdenum cofactor biosynthesis protein [Nodosilinea nodulosa]|uniref:MogA/MoaB family molybdenum cofactor biosynthesis protein n=1 Tax=Nodosilinea nodulosa TaxID=416001 RepID=UPI00031B1573|nr:MogA/MoaB family molybdenum cofactor biosynthesis protein [Nodosilinea nodulosa]